MKPPSGSEGRLRGASRAIQEVTAAPSEAELGRRVRRVRIRREAGRVVLITTILALAFASTLMLRSAFRTDRPAATTGRPLTALWPEHDAGALAEVQADLDANAADAMWRSDPEEVAARFASDVMGWRGSSAQLDVPASKGAGTAYARVGVCPVSGCPVNGPTFTEVMILGQLGTQGPGGAWSVIAAKDGAVILDPLDIGLPSPITVAEGRRLDPFTMSERNGGLPDGTTVSTGTLVWGACGPVRATELHPIWYRYLHFTVASPPDTICGGTAPSDVGGIRSGAVFTVWPPTSADAVFARLTGVDPAASSPDVVGGLSIYAVSIAPSPDGTPAPLPGYLDQDPSTLPVCRPSGLDIGAATSDGEAMPPRPYGIGISVAIKAGGDRPCMADLELSIDIVRGDGRIVAVGGDHRVDVRDPMPSYVPGTKDLNAVWRLGDWCPPLGEGPYSVRLSVDGRILREERVHVLDTLCTESAAEVAGGGGSRPRPPGGRGSPSLVPFGVRS